MTTSALSIHPPMAPSEQPPTSPPATDARPLRFCPFCRECFEDETQCPEHELALVPFDALPREDDPDALPSYEEKVAPLDLRFGRGIVMGGIALTLIGFAAPVLEVVTSSQARAFSGLEAATLRAPSLWTVPFVALMFVWILARRRTPLAMLGARLVALLCAVAPLVSLLYTALKVEQGARQFVEQSGQSMTVSLAWGAWVIGAGAVLLLIGSARLGVIPGAAKAARSVADRLRSP